MRRRFEKCSYCIYEQRTLLTNDVHLSLILFETFKERLDVLHILKNPKILKTVQ